MQGNILSQLHDIQTPDPVSWWPLAWGWYAAAVIIIAALWLMTVFYLRRKKKLKAKKQALQLLTAIDANEKAVEQIKYINNVLKRAVLAYANREDVAELSGKKWALWLNNVNPQGPQFDATLLSLAYQKECSIEQVTNLATQTQHWIKANLPLKQNKEKALV